MSARSKKPRLYHDIDGVLFAHYTMFPGARPVFQLRPGTRDWFRWVLKRYELIWTTTWKADVLQRFLSTQEGIYLDHVWTASRYLEWQTDLTLVTATKEAAIARDLSGYDGPWFWIDDFPDGVPTQFAPQSLVRVSDQGARELIELTGRLTRRLAKWHPPTSPPSHGGPYAR